jgi:predicted PurR-regulated permease PerM
MIVLGAFLFLASHLIFPYAIPLMMGGIMALLMYPLYQRLIRRSMKPMIAATIVTLLVVFAVVGPILVITLIATRQAMALAQTISQDSGQSAIQFLETLKNWELKFFSANSILVDIGDLREGLKDVLGSVLKSSSETMINTAKSLPDALLQILLAVLACFFFLLDGPRVVAWLMDKLPIDPEIRAEIRNSFQNTALSVVWASIAAAGTQSFIVILSFGILGIPSALLAGAATFIFAWIPLLGSAPVILAGSLYLYSIDSLIKLGILIILGILTGVVDNFVRPLVLKGRGEMHPLVSMVAIFGGIQLFGIVGVFLGPIIVAITITLLKIWPLIGEKAGIFVRKHPQNQG